MDTALTALGMLLIATAVTLLSSGPRTWLVAVAQGLGIQAIIGGISSAVQVGWFMDQAAEMTVSEKVITAVQGLPFHAAGWTGRMVFETLTNDKNPGAMSALGDYLPIAMAQMVIVAGVLGFRKMRDDGLTDPVQMLIWGLLIANSVCNAQWPWWGQ
jgi:hypothetical protein